jgi:integrase
VRRWRKKLLDSGASQATAAKAYRLLNAIMNTAVEDGLIRRNPCRFRGARQDKSPERPVLRVGQVIALADATEPRYRALILLAAFGSLRWGELAGLCRKDIDTTARVVRVERSLSELPGEYLFGPPKSQAGVRVVAIPAIVVKDIAWHLTCFTAPEDDALVFTSPAGGPLRHSNFRRRFWLPALSKAGLTGIHFHDLRHTGNNLTAAAGASLRELMDRMGHSSTRAALVYLHGSDARQHEIADRLSKLARAELNRPASTATGKPAGTRRARNPKQAS